MKLKKMSKTNFFEGAKRVMKVIGVRFKDVGKIYYFDPGDLQTETGAKVIVETARGLELGTVALPGKEIDEKTFGAQVKKALRLATEADLKKLEENARLEKEAYGVCKEKIRANKLEMNLVEVEYAFDRSKILFYFTADGRVDFRQLVKDLAGVFRTRIELRQIGVRDEAKMLGGLGVCGRAFCCSLFLSDFEPTSIKMAKEQSLSLNPTKISGVCGRLMCCLKYEQDAYEDLLRRTPNVGSVVKTPLGEGVVTSVSLLKGLCKVRLNKETEKALEEFPASALTTLKPGSRRDAGLKVPNGKASLEENERK
jgi:cell fate regulator YaaT (PSP1 superfamily)